MFGWLAGWLAGWLVTPTPTLQFTFSLLLLTTLYPASLLHCTDLHWSVQTKCFNFFLNVPGKLKFQTICKFKLGTIHLNTRELCMSSWGGILSRRYIHTNRREGIRTNLVKGGHLNQIVDCSSVYSTWHKIIEIFHVRIQWKVFLYKFHQTKYFSAWS